MTTPFLDGLRWWKRAYVATGLLQLSLVGELIALAQHYCLASTGLADLLGTYGSVVPYLFGSPWTPLGMCWTL